MTFKDKTGSMNRTPTSRPP